MRRHRQRCRVERPDAQLLTNVVRESEKAVPQSGPVKVLLRQHRIPLPPLTSQPKTSSTESEPTQSGATCNQPKANSGSAAEGDGS